MPWGQGKPPLAAAPSSDGILGAAATPREGTPGGGTAPPLPLYILEVWAAHYTRVPLYLGAALPLSFSSYLAVLGEALLDHHAPPPPPRRCAAAGWSLPQPLPFSLLDQGTGDVTGLHMC